jgi:hypothetical protein
VPNLFRGDRKVLADDLLRLSQHCRGISCHRAAGSRRVLKFFEVKAYRFTRPKHYEHEQQTKWIVRPAVPGAGAAAGSRPSAQPLPPS